MKIAGKILFFAALSVSCFCSCKYKYPVESVISLPDYKKGEALLGVNNDSAFYYFNNVANTARDSLQVATAYNNMAVIQSDAGDYFGSQESLLVSLQYLDEHAEKDFFCLSSDYNELGNSSLHLKNYDAAIAYCDLAIKFSRDDNFKAVVVNNKAFCFQQKKEYSKALALYNSIAGKSKTDKRAYARVLTNMAITKWLQDSTYRAAPELLTALQMRKNENDKWGLNSSYVHLSEYYAVSQPDSALMYAGKMYLVAKELSSPDDEMEALQKLIVLSKAGDMRPYFIRYQFLNDSLQTARNNAKNQFALIRFDAEKNKADNLALQRDNTEKKLQIIWQRIFLYDVLFVLIFGTTVAIAWYRKRKQQMIWDTQNAIREQQLKTSQKVHDVVANGLYRIMTEVEHKQDIDKEYLLDNIEALYERSRDISYEQPVTSNHDFGEAIASLLMSFAGSSTRILITGNDENVWNQVKEQTKNELEHVLQELMINMKKHSKAQNVVVKFERQDEQIKIQYADDGIGLTSAFRYGNGLTNTENRIKAIGGRIIFDRAEKKGLKIQVHFPITRQ